MKSEANEYGILYQTRKGEAENEKSCVDVGVGGGSGAVCRKSVISNRVSNAAPS